jgi:2-polyprenyl-3-methyl-5-hydroxy-6-metoxy-1,4-benzoquinol methylase
MQNPGFTNSTISSEMSYEGVKCNLCNGSDEELLFNIPDFMLEREDVITTLVRCRRCGLVYQNPRPTIKQMAMHYPQEYDPFIAQSSVKRSSWLATQAIEYGLNKRCRFVTRYKRGGRILDLGCATGNFLDAMSKRPGWELYGVEINSEAAQVARQQYHLNVFIGTLEQARFSNEYFDAITLWEVLEHLHDAAATLREIQRILKPDGLLVIRLPNLASWDAGLFGKYWAGYDAPRHLYVFNPNTIKKILDQAGLHIEAMSCRSGGYASFVISVNFWISGKKLNSKIRQKIQTILRSPVTNLVTAPFFFISNLLLRGSTLTIIARRLNDDQQEEN